MRSFSDFMFLALSSDYYETALIIAIMRRIPPEKATIEGE
jgi:hypothetical protein